MNNGWNVKALPCAERLREALEYDQDSGDFRWRVRPVAHFPNAVVAKRWNAKNAGCPAFQNRTHGYRAGKFDGVTYFAHRIAWLYVHGTAPHVVDHANGDRSDNRIVNLRSGTQSDNMRSAMARGTFVPRWPVHRKPLSGVRRARSGRWVVKFKRDNAVIYLGTFDCFAKALNARKQAEVKHVANL